MKFNKIFLSAIALAAVTMTSCSSEEDMPSVPTTVDSTAKAITFNTYNGNSTHSRASIFSNPELQQEGFGVFGLQYSGDKFISNSGWTYNYFGNQHVEWDASASSWTYSPVKYWPTVATDKMSFLAYAPYRDLFTREEIDGLQLVSDTYGGEPIISYTVPADVSKGLDLVYDNTKVDFTKPENGQVTFNFKHALACVGFDILKSADLEGDVVLDKVTIHNTEASPLCSKAKFNLYKGAWQFTDAVYDSGLSWVWTPDKIGNIFITTSATGTTGDGNMLMVIPDNASHELTFDIEYTLKVRDTNIKAGGYTITKNKVSITTYLKPAMGKMYNWRFYLTGDAVTMNAAISDWD